MSFEYEDILYLPHHVSPTRAKMQPIDRAAQFSPFAALTGYDAAVAEMARLTCERIELEEDARQEINAVLTALSRCLREAPEAAVTHFVPDERKQGGHYAVTEGTVRRINSQEGYLELEDGTMIFFEDIAAVRQLKGKADEG